MTGHNFRQRIAELVRRAGSQVELAKKSQLSDRAIRAYLTGGAKPRGETAARLAAAGRVRIAWLLTGAEPMEEGGIPRAEEPRATYRAINLKVLVAAIHAVEARMPLVAPEGKAGVIGACYDLMIARDTDNPEVLREFLDSIAGAVPGTYKVREPVSDEELQEQRRRRTTKK